MNANRGTTTRWVLVLLLGILAGSGVSIAADPEPSVAPTEPP